MDHLKNTETALFYWLTVPKENVMPGLYTWAESNNPTDHKHTCKTIACFGGWLPAMPEFAAMGVVLHNDGPYVKGHDPYYSLADDLFGRGENDEYCRLFASAQDCQYDDGYEHLSDHDLVTNRLREHIKVLKARAARINLDTT